jgi:hypothetical protein
MHLPDNLQNSFGGFHEFRIFSAITSACLRAALIVRHGYYRGAGTNIANRVAARHVDCVRSPSLSSPFRAAINGTLNE